MRQLYLSNYHSWLAHQCINYLYTRIFCEEFGYNSHSLTLHAVQMSINYCPGQEAQIPSDPIV